MDEQEIRFLKERAKIARIRTIDAIGRLGVGHVGGSLSVIEVLVSLYYRHMNVDPRDPRKLDRDRFVLSKGHAGPALYAVLADRGYFPVERLATLNQGGTDLPSHCDMNRTPGIDMTTGSLGQGLSAAVGMALGLRRDGVGSTVYVVLGDGECDEGQVWEAALAAAHFRLANLIAFIDYNKMQIDGLTSEIMELEDLSAKWSAFGWFVRRTDGHDFQALDDALTGAKEQARKPSLIILDTVKGKGAHFAEGLVSNHNMTVDSGTAREAIALLEREDA